VRENLQQRLGCSRLAYCGGQFTWEAMQMGVQELFGRGFGKGWFTETQLVKAAAKRVDIALHLGLGSQSINLPDRLQFGALVSLRQCWLGKKIATRRIPQ
jgi:hypothetical protein